ncbi:MAG: AI-2E family transporter [Pseudomonadota bacterium]
MQKPSQLIEQLVAVAAIFLLIGGCLVILAPFFAPLLWAAIISYCSWGIYTRLVTLLRGYRVIAALLLVLAVLLCVVGPFAYAIGSLLEQAETIKAIAHRLTENGVPALPDWVVKIPLVGERIPAYWNDLMKGDPHFTDFLRSKLAAPAGQWLLTVGTAAGAGLLQLVLSIFLTFFFYTGGQVAITWLQAALLRIAGERGRYLLQLAGGTIKGVVYGILGTALVQAILAGLGYWIAGVPAAGILGLATFFLSVVPMGPGLIWVPAGIWLIVNGSTGWGIFVLVWGAVVVSSVDNVIKPLMISRGGALPFIIVLLGVLGGALAFGFLGVFIGPTLLAVGYSVLHDWTVGAADTANKARTDRAVEAS